MFFLLFNNITRIDMFKLFKNNMLFVYLVIIIFLFLLMLNLNRSNRYNAIYGLYELPDFTNEVPPASYSNSYFIENFGVSTDNIRSILSRPYGIKLNVCDANGSGICDGGTLNSNFIILIDKDNTKTSQTLRYNNDGTYSLVIKNPADTFQLWKINKLQNTNDYVVSPLNAPNMFLMYENGVLSVVASNEFQGTRWLPDDTSAPNTIPLLSNQVSGAGFSSNFVENTPQNLQQITNQQYDQIMRMFDNLFKAIDNNTTPNLSQPAITPFNKSNNPLTINVKLGSDGKSALSKENFVDDNTNIISLLDRYEKNNKIVTDKLELNDLINGDRNCNVPDMNNYVSVSRLAECRGCSNL